MIIKMIFLEEWKLGMKTHKSFLYRILLFGLVQFIQLVRYVFFFQDGATNPGNK